MTTAQEAFTTSIPPFPFFIENPSEANSAGFPTDKPHTEPEPLKSRISDLPSSDVAPGVSADVYHVPPTRFAPKAYPYRYDDTLNLPPETEPLPDRCQFMFSDGRQCRMARSDIHPSLCTYHSEREEQLFGVPGPSSPTRGATFDLPELHSACRDLTTAAGVNRALAQVFRLLAQRRISRQEAATFGHLAQLLLRSISAARAESADFGDIADHSTPSHAPDRGASHPCSFREADDATGTVILSESALSSGERLPTGCAFAGQQSVEQRIGERRIPPKLSPANATAHPISTNLTRPPSADEPVPVSDLTDNHHAHHAKHTRKTEPNPRKMSTYENPPLKAVHNEHLHKNGQVNGHVNGPENIEAGRSASS